MTTTKIRKPMAVLFTENTNLPRIVGDVFYSNLWRRDDNIGEQRDCVCYENHDGVYHVVSVTCEKIDNLVILPGKSHSGKDCWRVMKIHRKFITDKCPNVTYKGNTAEVMLSNFF